MKKFTLITIVCLLTPCFVFAQEHANDFSIEGTLWRIELKGVAVTATDPPDVEEVSAAALLGFSDGKMFDCQITEGDTYKSVEYPNASYTDSPVISLAYVHINPEYAPQSHFRLVATMLPRRGVGYVTIRMRNWGHDPGCIFGYGSGSMVKVSDDWTP